MRIPFTKMHGCGNDFVVIDARADASAVAPALGPEAVRALADRRRGIGFDQLIEVLPGPAMRIWNPDGSRSATCGNATRCVAALLGAESGARHLSIATEGGALGAELHPDGTVSVDMGAPRLGWRDIPLARETDTLRLPALRPDLPPPAAASMGNPHATFFVPDLDALDIPAIGPGLEHDALFPERANIGFAQVLGPDRLRLRVWERGAGLTLACGSGACAAVVNAVRRGLTGRRVEVVLDGGSL
ncbi:diaminopimelate epimerase, partial [Acidisphaera rubrifaciens]|uniref:diaminopimelate epimerase n=1 Tax=Acidisphaera rubrifaciens TaxID=50715 RepID=UPI000662123D